MTWKRACVGVFLIVAGMMQPISMLRAIGMGRSWLLATLPIHGRMLLADVLCTAAVVGFMAAGFGVLGVAPYRGRSRQVTIGALAASVVMIVLFFQADASLNILVDVIALVLLRRSAQLSPVQPAQARVTADERARGLIHDAPKRSGRVAQVTAALVLVYVAAVLLLRPWFVAWGGRPSDLVRPLPGDELQPEPAFQVTRVITINSSPAVVWPWLAQMGQDRAGFYSYDFLERLAGFRVQNAQRVVPEWQRVGIGDLIRAAPPDFLGGALGPNVGWRVALVDPGRELVLTSSLFNWTFFLEPIDEQTTRLFVRGRADASPRLHNLAVGVAEFLGLGPLHFVMERRMMLTLKRLAEASPRGA